VTAGGKREQISGELRTRAADWCRWHVRRAWHACQSSQPTIRTTPPPAHRTPHWFARSPCVPRCGRLGPPASHTATRRRHRAREVYGLHGTRSDVRAEVLMHSRRRFNGPGRYINEVPRIGEKGRGTHLALSVRRTRLGREPMAAVHGDDPPEAAREGRTASSAPSAAMTRERINYVHPPRRSG
jgi:hypothetical protein